MRDLLFVTDFTNVTGNPVFDGVLREVAENELSRSPTAEVVDDDRISEMLRSKGQPNAQPLTLQLARTLCNSDQRDLIAEGAIKPQGSGFVIELTTMDCVTGQVTSKDSAEARTPDETLAKISKVAAETRVRLSGGTSTTTDAAPLPTSSIEAF